MSCRPAHNFNSRPSARGDTRPRACRAAQHTISIHAPPRGATQNVATWLIWRGYFNSRPSARGDADAQSVQESADISIHAPPRGATRGTYRHNCPALPISIHAPPRGATFSRKLWRQYRHSISIHAPPRGATRRRWRDGNVSANFNSRPSARGDAYIRTTIWIRAYFNSRPSARGDGGCIGRRGTYRHISIHAPPRGATTLWRRRTLLMYFNSRPSARGDTRIFAKLIATGQFQFTPLREGRRSRSWSAIQAYPKFQFTPLREGRPLVEKVKKLPDISIHAPPRGATAKDMQFLQIFCSTLTNQHGLTIVPRNLSRLFW